MTDTQPIKDAPRGRYLALLSLGALGVVYGDIGTSPLYAMRECFYGPHKVAPTHENVVGILSLIFWALIIIITIKYLMYVTRANNRGEGGIMALMSIIVPKRDARSGRGVKWLLAAMGIFGASLLYGDGVIAPTITVLSAVEGLSVVTPVFEPYVLPIAIVILIALFMFQKRGTGGVGAVFGPFNLMWFASIATLGIISILKTPAVLVAVNPIHAVRFFVINGLHGYLVLGSVFLVVTGGESLYADMGHFGRRPIRLAWFTIVLPALLLNYFGQGALLLRDATAVENPFFRIAPGWAMLPLVALATIAAAVASQAVISGAFSLTRQAVQLGYSPRMEINHTSAREIGQIYVPGINWLLMFGAMALVLGFRNSSAIANAYGVAVTTTMVITTILLFFVMIQLWNWPVWRAALLCGFFGIIDLAFFGANIIKVPDGGWVPLLVAASVFTLMTTWRRGRDILDERLRKEALPIDAFLPSLQLNPPIRVPGTAVFMYRNPAGTPTALLHNLKHNKVLHERVVLLTIETEERPHVPVAERVEIEDLGFGVYRVEAHYGFMEDPDVPAALARVQVPGLDLDPLRTSFFLGRETLIATKHPGMAIWRERLFAWMSRNARSAADFFRIPPNRVVEMGAQVEL
ncbi:MAG: potassium transporter Kup [Thermoanaerobaculia bacterium]